MTNAVHLWLRHETRDTERRAPLTPSDAQTLIAQGLTVTVEESPQRCFPINEYAAAGCAIAPGSSWVDAPSEAYILGLKELPEAPAMLRHRHIYFGHAYKGQDGAAELLERFRLGGGELLDIEYLTDESGRRVVAFGYWAGYVGAALGVLAHRGQLVVPLEPTDKPSLDALLAAESQETALVTGYRGRSGSGALDALATAGIAAIGWDTEQTRVLDKAALLGYDILVNCVVSRTPQQPFVELPDLAKPIELRTIADVTCDVTSANNMLPINSSITSWDRPVRRIDGSGHSVDVIAIDNLPSLLPREATIGFSADLTPQLALLGTAAITWSNALAEFTAHQDPR